VQPLRILHVLRAPVGGLFRHVCDLAAEQTRLGHAVGLIADSATGGEQAGRKFAELSAALSLGISRVPMSRHAGFSDISAVRHVREQAQALNADVVHGHGAKGGAYARLGAGSALRVYTPHGGSLHFSRSNPGGFAYLTVESLLLRKTDLVLFESEYARRTFEMKVGKPRGLVRVVHNGVRTEELQRVMPAGNTAEVLFVGELRMLKGVDVLLDAIAILQRENTNLRAVIVGDGPDRAAFEGRRDALGLSKIVTFAGAMPAREAFARGRILVVPSRAESLPYIVLEAAAAGLPVVATDVGGIAEIFGDERDALVPAGDASALAAAVRSALLDGAAARAAKLHQRISEKFTVTAMTDAVLGAYGDALLHRSA
jgi:glycosyltransferase involved in cell wall biosynthesis